MSRVRSMTRTRMFFLLIARAVGGRGSRVATAVAAIALAAIVTTALGNLQASLGGKLQGELEAFGPNILVTRSGGGLLTLRNTREALRQLHLTGFQYVNGMADVLHSGLTTHVPVEQLDPVQARPFRSWWQISGRWMSPEEGMVGESLAHTLNVQPGDVVAVAGTYNRKVRVVGIVTAGGEDDRTLFLPLNGNQTLNVDGVEVRSGGDEALVNLAARRLQSMLAGARVHVLQRVARADTLMLQRLIAVFGLLGFIIVVASGLCVATTFTTMVNERSREIGLQKALGATDSQVVALFWGEALLLSASGTLVGYILGIAFAGWIGESVFGSAVSPRIIVFPLVLAVAVGMTLLAAVPSARRIARLDPAVSLKGSRIETAG